MDNLGILSGLPMPNLLFPCCSPFMYSALVMATLYGCRCLTCKKTNALKRSMAMTESQRNDLILNQMSKCPRLDQQQTSPVRPSPSSMNELNSRKCTGTQTLYSSFVPAPSVHDKDSNDPYFRKPFYDEEPCFILDLDRHMMGKSHPPRSGKSRATNCNENEINNIPLNLTVPSVKPPVRPLPPAVRPLPPMEPSHISVRPPPPMDPSHISWSPGKTNVSSSVVQINGHAEISGSYNGGPGWRSGDRESFRPIKKMDSSKMSHRDIWNESKPIIKTEQNVRKFSSSVECDKGVEEHFKRSLGKDYPQRLGKPNPPSPPNSTTSINSSSSDCRSDVSVTGAVDDHFAKSLGQTWTKIKSQSDPNDPRGQPGSVDDHFAKALGDMWYKIKAEKNNS